MKYEAATTLTTLTQNPAAVKAAATCFIDLIVKESDNNVKMIVLDRVEALRSKHEHVLDDMVMDILRVLSACVAFASFWRPALKASAAPTSTSERRLSLWHWTWSAAATSKTSCSSSRKSSSRP